MAFIPQNFVDRAGPPISAAFLNGIDVLANFVFNGAQTVPAAQTALGLGPLVQAVTADANGHVTVVQPTTPGAALTVNGAVIPGGSSGDVVINTLNGVGLGVNSATAPFSQIYVKNTLNSATSFAEIALSADGTTNNFFMTLTGSAATGGAKATLGVFGAVPVNINSNGAGGITLLPTGAMGLYGAAPVAAITGFGAPVGAALVANYNSGSSTALQDKQTIAEILAVLLAVGLIKA